MGNAKIYKEIKEWFDSGCDLKQGMILHTKYAKSHSNKTRLAKQPLKRKILLPSYLKAIMELNRPDDIKVEQSSSDVPVMIQDKKYVKSIGVKLKEEFPKLEFNSLPPELQLLVLKRYQKWEEGKHFYEEQQNAETDKERFETAKKTVLSTKENWEIWAELDHYHKHGKVLGKHKSFTEKSFLDEIKQLELLPAVECTKELTRIRVNRRNAINRLLNIEKKKGNLSVKQKELLDIKINEFDIVSVKLNEPKWYN